LEDYSPTFSASPKYVLRQVEMVIEGTALSAPVAWLQSDLETDVLLGRSVVFDTFDIEFKQTARQIIFKLVNPAV
jgi:hypothetical protein